MMDATKVDLVIRYALSRAAHGESPWERQLGPIHLLKFVYLADVAFAERNGGVTFTGADWAFFHYGPWSAAVHDRVRAVAPAIAQEFVFTSTKYDNDAIRWALADLGEAEEIEAAADRDLPTVVSSAVRRAVREFGNDTPGLLHYVYNTAPMLRAAPRDALDFSTAVIAPAINTDEVLRPRTTLTRKQEKRREEARRELQDRAREKLKELREKRATMKPLRQPRYDQVFVEGQKWLDQLGGTVEEEHGELEFDEAVWTSRWRWDPGN